MPDGYDNDRDGIDPNTRGRIFENGAHTYFRDKENGYTQQSRTYKTVEGKARFDNGREDQRGTSTIEDKSGRVEGPKDVKQFKVVREILQKDPQHKHMLRSVEGESISKECQDLIQGLKRDFPDRFTHLVISRTEARAIWAIGKDLERERGKQVETPAQGKQLEIPGVGEKAREEKAQELQKARDRQATLAKAREAREKFRAVQAFRDGVTRGRAEAPQRIQAERAQRAHDRATAREAPETERDRAARLAAEKAVREFQDRLRGAPGDNTIAKASTPERESPEAARARVEQEAREQVLREFPLPAAQQPPERESVEIGERSTPELNQAASVAREAADKAQAAEREAADKAREDARERAKALEQHQLQGISPEVRNLLALGQAQPPAAAVETKPGYAPGVERGGTGQAQGRDRGQSRDR